MIEREIAVSDWATFGARFTDQHRGWLVSATRRTASGVEHFLWKDEALESVSIDPKTGAIVFSARTVEHGTGATITVSSGTPRRLVELATDEGGHAGLRIDTADGGSTELHFRVSALPETVNGMAADA
jgi:hypothetical protein